MATLPLSAAAPQASGTPAGRILVCLPSITADALASLREHLAAAVAPASSDTLLFATPDVLPEQATANLLPYATGGRAQSSWVLTASDYAAASRLALEHNAAATLILGAEAATLSPDGVHALLNAVLTGADLAMPRYQVGPHEGLISSALLYPLTRTLFGPAVHAPLTIDAAFSPRMAGRLGSAARRPAGTAASEPLLWPVAEAASAGLSVREVPVGPRSLPQPTVADLNALLAEVAASIFTDIEARAAFWQRARPANPATAAPDPYTPALSEDLLAEIRPMVESFRNAFANLQEIWSLVLPPHSLLALKKLSLTQPSDFNMPANLWARVVYDFVLAYHLRTLNRGHLLGAMMPLYLAWVASHLRASGDSTAAATAHAEQTAAAFEAEKPYLVARWRWPDRFNP